MGHRQRSQQAGGGAMRSLAVGADRASGHELLSDQGDHQPPKATRLMKDRVL